MNLNTYLLGLLLVGIVGINSNINKLLDHKPDTNYQQLWKLRDSYNNRKYYKLLLESKKCN